jgi:hypothetical protein
MNEYFGCDNVRELKQYVGWVCKIDEKNGSKTVGNFTTGNYIHEFSIISSNKIETLASSGDLFSPVSSGDELNEKEQKRYRTGVGKWLYLLRWS